MKTLMLIVVVFGVAIANATTHFVNYGSYGKVEFSEGQMGIWIHLDLRIAPSQRGKLVFLPQCSLFDSPTSYWQFKRLYEIPFRADEVGLVRDSLQSYEIRIAELQARRLKSIGLFVLDGSQWILVKCSPFMQKQELTIPPSPLVP